jgi:hypothetical protein
MVVMPRLSVSLDSEQVEWIEGKKREMGVSKGKVIRECIDEVRTGDSLLTTTVQSDESTDSDRLETLESRLASLEQTLQNSTITADSDGSQASDRAVSPPNQGATNRPDQQAAPGDIPVDSRVAEESQSGEEQSASAASSGEHSTDTVRLPGPVLGDLDPVPTPEAERESTGPESPDTGSESETASSTAAGPSPDSSEPSGDDHDPSPAVDELQPEAGGGEDADNDELAAGADQHVRRTGPAPPSTRAEGPVSPSPSGSDDSRSTESAAQPGQPPTSSPEPTESHHSPEDEEKDEDEVEKYDVDKSDPSAVQERLQAELEANDHATAVFACWKRLRDRGTLHTRAMQSLYEDYPLGHADAREWWHESIQPELAKVPGVQPPEGGGKLYRFSY